MILGLSSFTFGWAVGIPGYTVNADKTCRYWDENDLIHFMQAHGLNCLQLGDNLPLHAFDSTRLEKLRNTLDVTNTRFEPGARKLTPGNLQTYLDLAAYFQSPLLRFVLDGDHYEPDLPEVIALLKDCIPELKKSKLILGIENHDRLKAKAFASIVEACGSDRIGICLDTVNSLGAGEGLDYVLDILAPYTVNLHIKDFTVERLPHNMGFQVTGVPAGNGQCDIPGILDKLNGYGRCHSAILEQWVPFTKDYATTIALENKWAETSLDYLKSLNYFNLQ